jgi:succinate dehydrogenase/fumarate reductase flavoprotein subunit
MVTNTTTQWIKTDVLVIGGGTAGTMAAIKAKQANPDADVLILEKANIRRSGAIAMGMDGVNTTGHPIAITNSTSDAGEVFVQIATALKATFT